MSMKVENSELTEGHRGAKVKKKEVKLPLFSFASVAAATDKFSDANNELGEGGFGPVYKAPRLASRPAPPPSLRDPFFHPQQPLFPSFHPATPFLKRPPPARHHSIFGFTLCIWVSATPFPAKQREEAMEHPKHQHSQR
ncbi:hypothetical protein Fmac_021199 [Flemingia macrophylla]|uniref:Uncharacterized protein n=1 Tax=Flemingia macrophylla TaxID=520843 RepID=A0ABD1LW80_9FABA